MTVDKELLEILACPNCRGDVEYREQEEVIVASGNVVVRQSSYTFRSDQAMFDLPHKHLEAEKAITDTVAAGRVSHKLKVGGNDQLEIYDYPGGYA